MTIRQNHMIPKYCLRFQLFLATSSLQQSHYNKNYFIAMQQYQLQKVQLYLTGRQGKTRILNSFQNRVRPNQSKDLNQSKENCVNGCQALPQGQGHFSVLQLQLINQTLREQSLAHFMTMFGKAQKLAILMRDWSLYELQFRQAALAFLNLVDIKAALFRGFFYLMFEGLEDLTRLLKLKLQLKETLSQKLQQQKAAYFQANSRDRAEKINKQLIFTIQRGLQIKFHPCDQLFLQIIEQVQQRHLRPGDQYLQQLFSRMAQLKQFQSVQSYWVSIFDKFDLYAREHSGVLMKQPESKFLKDIQNERIMNLNCLGCMRYAYENTVIKQASHQTPVAIFPSIHKIREIQTQVKEKVVAMMNTGGGVILFNCTKQFFNIRMQGCRISQKEKQAYQQILVSFLPSFYPRLTLNHNIVISFIPMVSLADRECEFERQLVGYKGEEGLVKYGQAYYQREYIQGFYVCRIKICPFQDRRVCLWLQKEGDYQTAHLNLNSKNNSEESIKNLRKVQRKNLAENHCHGFNQLHQHIKRTYSYFDHQCESPQPGIMVSNSIKSSQSEFSRSKDRPEHSYKYMSLLIVKIKYLQSIKQKLKRYGNNVFIDRPFTSYKFKPATHTAVLYHNIKFQTLLKEVCLNREYQFQGKNLLAINITPFVRLNSRNSNNMFSRSQFENIESWLHNQFPKQKLKVWQFKNKEDVKEYYLETSSKLSMLFIYYLLGNFKEPVAFKCPNGLDKMSQQEKRASFKEVNFGLGQSQPMDCAQSVSKSSSGKCKHNVEVVETGEFYQIGQINQDKQEQKPKMDVTTRSQNPYQWNRDRFSFRLEGKG